MMRFIPLFMICLLLTAHTPVYAGDGISAKQPSVEAAGAILMDYKTGRVLWGKNAHKPLAMASTTKIMTAILALEKGNLSDTVKVSRRASLAPKVNMDLKEGEEIRLDYLLYALMLQSSNDAAVAVAEHIGGTVEDFCAMMTARSRELGAVDTVFETPNGLDFGEHHSTAYDMAMITRYALSMPRFVEIINTHEVTAVSSKTTRVITNKNRLLNEYDGANGVKTGFTGKAGHCFVGAAKRGDMQLISVVLASGWGNKGKEQKWRDTKAVLNYGFDNFSYKQIVEAGGLAGEMSVSRSKTALVPVYYSNDILLVLSKDEAEQVSVVCDYLQHKKAPVNKEERVGVAKVYLSGQLYGETDIVTGMGAARHDLKTSLEKVISGWLNLGTVDEIYFVLPETE